MLLNVPLIYKVTLFYTIISISLFQELITMLCTLVDRMHKLTSVGYASARIWQMKFMHLISMSATF